MNRHKDVLWFNKESFEYLVSWMNLIGVLNIADLDSAVSDTIDDNNVQKQRFPASESEKLNWHFIKLLDASEKAKYRVEHTLEQFD